MEIKFNLQVIIIIVLLLFILWSHMICSCCTFNFSTLFNVNKQSYNKPMTPNQHQYYLTTSFPTLREGLAKMPTKPTPATATTYKKKSKKEGFEPINNYKYVNNYPDPETPASYSVTGEKPVDTSSWFTPNLTYTKNGSKSQGVIDMLNRPAQPIPLPEGEMLMFANTGSSPSCCPSAYSNSTGCLCMTNDQYKYLIDRGGNNVPYSEY
jgi:hypothetical protein